MPTSPATTSRNPSGPWSASRSSLERKYKGRIDPDAGEYIQCIVNAGKRMQNLINDLLEFSRVNTKGGNFRPIDATAVVEDAIAFLHTKTQENGATVTYNPLPRVMADAGQLRQVFSNLISNAIKFRKTDVPPVIHISTQNQDGTVQFSVADNGIGIEPQYLYRIFVIFQRLHGMDACEGTGIGLAIVKRIIDRHGGKIWVESEPGEGIDVLLDDTDDERIEIGSVIRYACAIAQRKSDGIG